LPFSVSTNPSEENGRLLIGRRDRSVGIWRLGEPTSEARADGEDELGGGGWEKLIDLEFKVSSTLCGLVRSRFAIADL
jgi:hypothetical protein